MEWGIYHHSVSYNTGGRITLNKMRYPAVLVYWIDVVGGGINAIHSVCGGRSYLTVPTARITLVGFNGSLTITEMRPLRISEGIDIGSTVT